MDDHATQSLRLRLADVAWELYRHAVISAEQRDEALDAIETMGRRQMGSVILGVRKRRTRKSA